MNPNKAREIFIELVSHTPPEQWDSRLIELAGEDRELHARVAALLAAHREADSFLERPADLLGEMGDVAQTSGLEFPGVAESAGTEQPGVVLAGRYKLLEEIGEGGMGTVWMAEQREPVQRQVAIKIIKAGMDSRQVVARFEAERQALALMDHPNIAKVFDGGATAGARPFFVMELVKGQPITKYCDEHRLTPRERLELFLPVCQAIQHAHQKGIIHRDIKPSNVLVASYDGRPVPKIIDFGVAKATGQRLTEHTLFTGFGSVVGTLEYMSPEQAELNNQDIDTRSDIYSLGVLLYELLTGTTPLSRERLSQAAFVDMLRLIREEEPPRPSARLSESHDALPAIAAQRHMEPGRLAKLVRGELDWIVVKALEKDRNRRYETANGLAMDVQRYLADEPVQACPPSVAYRFRKFARQHKAGLAIAGLVLFFLILLGAGAGWVLRDREARRQETAQQTRESLIRVRQWLGENKLALARQELAAAKGRMGKDRAALGDLADEVEALDSELARLQGFLDLVDRAHDAEFPQATALAPRADTADGRLVAPQYASIIARDPAQAVPHLLAALACYGALEQDDWSDQLEGGPLEPDQVARVRRTAYEELLWLADDVVDRRQDHRSGREVSQQEAAQEGLAYLRHADTAARAVFKNPTSAYHQIRARCLKALGTEGEARKHEQLARQTPAAIALDHYLLAHAAFDARNKAEAVQQFEAALRLEPTHYRSLLNLGDCLLQLGGQEQDFVFAAAAFTGCIMKRPDHPSAYSGRGIAYARLHRAEAALADCSKAIDLNPNSAWAWGRRGVACERLGQPDKALADYSKAIELDPKDAWAWSGRGNVRCSLRQFDAALADYSKAIELNPKMASAWNNRSRVYYYLEQPAKALDDCSKAIELDPKYGAARLNRCLALLELGKLDKALADCTKAVALFPGEPWAWTNRGCILRELGQSDKALADYSKAIELDPKDAWAWRNRGGAFFDLGQMDAAVDDCSKAIELDPRNAYAWGLRGNAYWRSGQPRKAIPDSSKAVELDPMLSGAWGILGRAYASLGEREKSLANFATAIELDPKDPWNWNGRGWALCHLGQPAAAARSFAEAFARVPALADNLDVQIRYRAACAAALAGCGQGEDGAKLDDAGRARLRQQAHDWLLADLEAWRRLRDEPADRLRLGGQPDLPNWQEALELAGFRGDALSRLPEDERQLWRQLWLDWAELSEAMLIPAIATKEKRLSQSPQVARYRDQLAQYQANLVLVLKNQGRTEDVEKHCRRAVEFYGKLAADNPGVPELRNTLARSHLDLGRLLKETGRANDAEKAFCQSLEIWDNLLAIHLEGRQYRLQAGTACHQIGELQDAAGRSAEAERSYRRALELFKTLAAECPAEAFYRQELANTSWFLGRLLQDTGRAEEAEQSYRRGLGIYERLAVEKPAEPFYRQEQAHISRLLAGLMNATGRAGVAETLYRSAMAIHEKLLAECPKNSDYRSRLYRTQVELAENLLAQNKPADAANIAKKISDTFPNDPEAQQRAAALLACVPELAEKSQLPPPELIGPTPGPEREGQPPKEK